MHYPQVLVYEGDGRLAEQLRLAGEDDKPRKWVLRQPRGLESCLRLLRRAGPSALVLKIGKDLVRELAIVDAVNWSYPETAIIVVGDTDHAVLAGLAWELGASLVLFPPLPREWLGEIVAGFLKPSPRTCRTAVLEQPEDELLLPDEEA
jgi:hypothetical protein